MNASCLKDIVNYVSMNNLADVFTLEIVPKGQHNERFAEIEVARSATALLPESSVEARGFFPTTWSGSLDVDGFLVRQTWRTTTDGPDKVTIDEPTDRALIDQGFITSEAFTFAFGLGYRRDVLHACT